MKTFTVYSARMVYHEFNKLIGTVEAYDLKGAKELIKKPLDQGGLNLNPFYAVIVDHEAGATLILHNEFLQFVLR
jgi:hypothetical protein